MNNEMLSSTSCVRRLQTVDPAQVARTTQADADSEVRREAVEKILIRYLPILKAHLLARKQLRAQEVDDLLQGFICDRIIAADLLAQVDRRKGRFRPFLLAALRSYVARVRRRHFAARRRPDKPVLSIEELGNEAGIAAAPVTDSFDQGWADEVIRQTIDRMRGQCLQPRRRKLWELFECRVLRPAFQNTPPLSYQQIVDRLGYDSSVQASNALVTAKRLFARTLRSVIGQYARDEAEIESQMVELWRIIAARSRGRWLVTAMAS